MSNVNNEDPFASDLESDSETQENEETKETPDAPDVISSIYKSMSQIIEALNTDNLILNQQVNKIRGELEFVCNTLATLKMDTQEISTVCSIRSEDLNDLKKKIATLGDLQKHVVETRNILIQTLDTNIKSVKKELLELKNNKDNIRPFIKSIVEEEVKQYLASMPSLEKRFEALEREQRTMLANHIRKSVVQSRNTALQAETDNFASIVREEIGKHQDIQDIHQLKEQQRIFMEKIETYLAQFKEKLAVV